MSRNEVQQELGYPPRSLTRWEKGDADPGFEKVFRLAELYGVATDWIAGRTPIEKCIKPGMVLIDDDSLDVLEGLVARGASVRDVPRRLVRHPGINYAVTVPDKPTVVAPEAAEIVERRLRSLWNQLGGKKHE